MTAWLMLSLAIGCLWALVGSACAPRRSPKREMLLSLAFFAACAMVVGL